MPVDLTGGLPPERELFLDAAPEDGELRQATNIWLHDDAGRFSLPRFGIEQVGARWATPGVQANLAFAGGRVLVGSCVGPAHPARDATGRPAVLGAGPVELRCVEPFRRWTLRFRGPAVETEVGEQASGRVACDPLVDVELEAELVMAVPPWVEAAGTPAQKSIDTGHRHEQLFRATGQLRVGGQQLDFSAGGLRIWRRGVRTMSGFGGHCWQAAVFPSGRAFGYTALAAPEGSGTGYRAGFVFDGERIHPAVATVVPWLEHFEPEGGDVSVELRSALGVHRISGRTTTSSAIAGRAALATVAALNSGTAARDLFLHQGGARYTWEGEQAYGMIERSAPDARVTRGVA